MSFHGNFPEKGHEGDVPSAAPAHQMRKSPRDTIMRRTRSKRARTRTGTAGVRKTSLHGKPQLLLKLCRQSGQHDFGDVIAGKVEKVAEDARSGSCHPQVLMATAATGTKAVAQHAVNHDAVPAKESACRKTCECSEHL